MADNKVEPFIVERALNHTLQGVMGIYNRAEYEAERVDAAEKLEAAILEVLRRKTDSWREEGELETVDIGGRCLVPDFSLDKLLQRKASERFSPICAGCNVPAST